MILFHPVAHHGEGGALVVPPAEGGAPSVRVWRAPAPGTRRPSPA